jgi:cytochrome c2
MKSANISWDEGTLDKFLANPANKLYGLVGAPRDSNELERLTPWLG